MMRYSGVRPCPQAPGRPRHALLIVIVPLCTAAFQERKKRFALRIAHKGKWRLSG